MISYLEKRWNAEITVQNSHINLFTGIVNLDHLQVKSKNKVGCLWTSKNANLHIFREQSVREKCIVLHIELNDNQIETEYEKGELGLSCLLQAIFKIKSKYFRPQSFSINGAKILMRNSAHLPCLDLDCSMFVKNDKNDLWKGRIKLKKGSVSLDEKLILSDLKGRSLFGQTNNENSPVEISTNHTFKVPFLQKNALYTLRGEWDPIKKYVKLMDNLDGISLRLTPSAENLQVHGKISTKDFYKKDLFIKSWGKINWRNKKRSSNLSLKNRSAVELFHLYNIAPNDFSIEFFLDKDGTISGNYNLLVSRKYAGNKICTNGKFKSAWPIIKIFGTSPYGTYNSQVDLSSKQPIKKCVIKKNGKTVVTFKKSKPTQILFGTMQYNFIVSLLPIHVRKWFLGSRGTISTKINFCNNDIIGGEISFSDGNVRIAENYNLITNIFAKFKANIQSKKIEIFDGVIKFKKGTALCPRAIFCWGDSGEIIFAHAYIQAKNILVNWKNDFFAFIDSNLFIRKEKKLPLKIEGDILIRKSLFKESIFSGSFSTQVAQSSILPFTPENHSICLDLKICNKDNLLIKTAFLQTQATTDLKLTLNTGKNQLASPQIKGTIILRKGFLSFPKNKLTISSGKIYFIPTQINNPMVYLTAKNRIKKYLVSLYVAGPLQNPTIVLESNPELSEEQIIALLFAGSEHMTLRSDLPAIIMQNLNTLILGRKKYLSTSSNFFQKITKPLRYIQITPDFSDQSGRGGVKGTISIDINKQLHAHIQKNFSTQDDLSFQLEYFLTDKLNIKMIKDHRGDLGAEVEMAFSPFQ
jgi:hypothetical protein